MVARGKGYFARPTILFTVTSKAKWKAGGGRNQPNWH